MEQKASSITAPVESAFSILQLLSDEQIQVQGPDETGEYTLRSAGGALPEGAARILTALEGLDSLRVPAERLGKDLRRFLKDRDLTGGGMLLLAGLRLFFIRREGRDAYGLLMDRRFQETAPMPEVRLQHLIAALRAMDGQKGLFHTTLRRVYRAVEIPGILLESVRIAALTPHEVEGLTVEGKVFVLAGGLTREERARAKALITAQGGRCATSLSGRTDYLAAGSTEKLRENTLLQFRALQSKGREIQLLNAASLFALLGETYQETGSPTETASIEPPPAAEHPPILETATAEPVLTTVHPPILEANAAETVPAAEHPAIPETATAEPVLTAVHPPILEATTAETVPAAEHPAIPETTTVEPVLTAVHPPILEATTAETVPAVEHPAIPETATAEPVLTAVHPPILEANAAKTVPAAEHPAIPETATAEPVLTAVHPPILEANAAKTVPAVERPPIPETAAAETVPVAEHPPIPETTAPEAVPAIPEEPAQLAALSTEAIPAMASAPVLEAAAARTPGGAVPDMPASTATKTNLRAKSETPDRAADSGNSAAEEARSTIEAIWNDAWESTMESARAAEARAIAETSAQIKQLQEDLAAKERQLQTLGRWKFGERIAARQEIHRLNQALRSAKAELSRLTARMA